MDGNGRSTARPPHQRRSGTGITYDWYRTFLQFLLDGGHFTWFAKLVVIGEVLVGVGLILGAFTGIAAFFGAFMNMAFMLAGTTSTNPVMFTVAILIMAAWKVAGFTASTAGCWPKSARLGSRGAPSLAG